MLRHVSNQDLGYNYAVAISRCGNGDTFQIFAIPGRDTPNSLSGLLGMSFGVVYKGATDDYKFSDLRDAYSSEKSTITMKVPRDGGVLISKTHAFALILTSIQNMVGADELSKFIYHNPSGIQKMLVTLALQLESKGNIGAPLTDIGAASRDAIVETSSDWLEDMIGSYYPPFKLLMKYGKVTSILVAYSEAKNSAKGGDEINLSNLYIKSICRKNIIYGGGSSW